MVRAWYAQATDWIGMHACMGVGRVDVGCMGPGLWGGWGCGYHIRNVWDMSQHWERSIPQVQVRHLGTTPSRSTVMQAVTTSDVRHATTHISNV